MTISPDSPEFRFEVALSFAGPHRDKVRAIAERLSEAIDPGLEDRSQGRVFFDEWFEHEILGSDMDVLLQNFYHRQSLMVVADVSEEYAERPWTQAEARAIRALRFELNSARDETARLRLLNARFGDGEVPGVFKTEGTLDGIHKSSEECANVILKRRELLRERLGQPHISTDELDVSRRKRENVFQATVNRPQANRPWAIYGALSLLFLCVAIFSRELLPNRFDSNGGIPSVRTNQPPIANTTPETPSRTTELGNLRSPANDGLPPPRPHEPIPSFAKSRLPPLTENDRNRAEFKKTTITIINETSGPIRLSFDNETQPSEEQDSIVGHRVTEVISGRQKVDIDDQNFGGPYHIQVLANGRWFPENVWVDLAIVPKRTIVVSKNGDGFQCSVKLQEAAQ